MISRAYWRFLLQSPWSTVLATLGVALGVVSIVSVHLVSVQIGEGLQQLSAMQFSGITHLLHREDLTASQYFDLRAQWRSGALGDVGRIAAFVDEETTLEGKRVRVIGVDLLDQGWISRAMDGAEGTWTKDSAGQDLPAQRQLETFSWRSVWVSRDMVDFARYPINGILNSPTPTIVADIGIAQEILGAGPDHLSYVGIEVSQPWANARELIDKLLPGASAGLPEQTPSLSGLSGWQVSSLSSVQPMDRFAQSILFNVSALATLAILVAWFLIYQVAVTWLRRLRSVFERLHTLGVGNVAIAIRFLVMLAALGLVASVIGVFAGWGLASWLLAVAIGEPASGVALDGWIVVKALGSAVGVCVIGGWLAYRQQRERDSRVVTVAVLAALSLLCLLGVFWSATGLAGAFVSIAALSFMATLTMRPVLDSLRTASRHFAGHLLRRLSARELFWYPRDLSVALGGLVLAVATAMGVGLMVDSFRGDFAQMLDRRLTYDIVVDGSDVDLRNALDNIAATQGVSWVQSYVSQDERVDGIRVQITQTLVNEFEAKRYGLERALDRNEILVSEQFVQAFRLRGNTMEVGAPFGSPYGAWTIAGIFRSFGDTQPRMVTSPSAMAQDPTSLSLLLRPGVDLTTVLETLRDANPTLRFAASRDVRTTALTTFDRTFTITSILITIAMVVAGAGIYIANQALRLNKAASNDLLDMLGVTKFEAWMMDFSRSMVMGVTAVLMALPLGSGFAWILCNVVNPRAFGWSIDLTLNVGAIAYPAMWGIVASVVAGLIRLGVKEEARFGDSRAAA